MGPPGAVVCHLCGGKYFKHSLPIHLKKCEEKWRKTHSRCEYCGLAVAKHDWKDHYSHCETKGKKKLYKKNTKPLTPPKSVNNQMLNLSSKVTECNECETENAEWKCNECEQYLCIMCENELHKKGSRQRHIRIPLTAKALSNPKNLALLKNNNNNNDNKTISPKQDHRKCCKFCERKFNPDRIEKHQRICKKALNKKRKVYDSESKRLEGTEFVKYKYNRAPTPPQVKYWRKHSRRWKNESKCYQEFLKEIEIEEKIDENNINIPRIKDKNGKILCTEKDVVIKTKNIETDNKVNDDDSKLQNKNNIIIKENKINNNINKHKLNINKNKINLKKDKTRINKEKLSNNSSFNKKSRSNSVVSSLNSSDIRLGVNSKKAKIGFRHSNNSRKNKVVKKPAIPKQNIIKRNIIRNKPVVATNQRNISKKYEKKIVKKEEKIDDNKIIRKKQNNNICYEVGIKKKKKISAAGMLRRGEELGRNVKKLEGKAKDLKEYMERERLRRVQMKNKKNNSVSVGNKTNDNKSMNRIQIRNKVRIENEKVGGTIHNKPRNKKDLRNKRANIYKSKMNNL